MDQREGKVNGGGDEGFARRSSCASRLRSCAAYARLRIASKFKLFPPKCCHLIILNSYTMLQEVYNKIHAWFNTE